MTVNYENKTDTHISSTSSVSLPFIERSFKTADRGSLISKKLSNKLFSKIWPLTKSTVNLKTHFRLPWWDPWPGVTVTKMRDAVPVRDRGARTKCQPVLYSSFG